MRRTDKHRTDPVCYRRRRHRPRPSVLVGWTKEDEEMMERAAGECKGFIERRYAGIGLTSLPMVDAGRYCGHGTAEPAKTKD